MLFNWFHRFGHLSTVSEYQLLYLWSYQSYVEKKSVATNHTEGKNKLQPLNRFVWSQSDIEKLYSRRS